METSIRAFLGFVQVNLLICEFKCITGISIIKDSIKGWIDIGYRQSSCVCIHRLTG